MAPEIMKLQKYDAKVTFLTVIVVLIELNYFLDLYNAKCGPHLQADLWSVGAILFQLVTGKTPFTGNSQMQVLLKLCFV